MYKSVNIEIVPLSETILESCNKSFYMEMINDPENHNDHGRQIQTPESLKSFVESCQKENEIIFAVIICNETRNDKVHIGNIAIQHLDKIHRHAEIAFLISRQFRSQGIGQTCADILLKHCFERLNLHRVSLGTTEINTAMKKIAERCGMKKEGEKREAFYHMGKYINLYNYSITQDEYFKDKQ